MNFLTISRQRSAFMLPSKPNLAPLRFRWNHQLADGIKDRFDLVNFSLYWISQFVISNFPFLPFWSAGLRRVVHCTSLNPHAFSPPRYAKNPNIMDTLHPLKRYCQHACFWPAYPNKLLLMIMRSSLKNHHFFCHADFV